MGIGLFQYATNILVDGRKRRKKKKKKKEGRGKKKQWLMERDEGHDKA